MTKNKKKNVQPSVSKGVSDKKPLEITTVYLWGLGIACIIFLGVLATWLFRTDTVLGVHDYFNEELNYTLRYASPWVVLEPEQESVVEMLETYYPDSIFDMYFLPVGQKVLSTVLVVPSKKETDLTEQFMTFSFQSSISNPDLLTDFEQLMDDFKDIMEQSNLKDTKVSSVEAIRTDHLNGVVLYGEGKRTGVPYYYTQYYEKVGANYMEIVYATKKQKEKGLDPIIEILDGLYFFEGDIVGSPIESNEWVETDDHDHEGEEVEDHTHEETDDHDHDHE